MPAPRINMRKLKDALRPKFEGHQSHQQIATALDISKGDVNKYVGLAKRSCVAELVILLSASEIDQLRWVKLFDRCVLL
jgi:hypothetical protein